MPGLSPFGKFCVEKRRQNRQLLLQMADATGVPLERLSQAELGEAPVDKRWIGKIAAFLQLTDLETRRLQIIADLTIIEVIQPKQERFSSAAFQDTSKLIQWTKDE